MAEIFVGIGSNIDREQHIASGIDMLREAFGELSLSPIYESESFGFSGPSFFNLVACFESSKSIGEVLAELKRIEAANGRVHGAKKFASRTLDIDILLYDDVVCSQPCELPRGEVLENAFVLRPLAELAGERIHPIAKQSYHALWQAFDKQYQPLNRVSLT